MARVSSTVLDSGDKLPSLTFNTVEHGTINTSEYLKGSFGIVLFYRGSWCPFCKTQLKSFQSGLSKLSDEGIKILAVSNFSSVCIFPNIIDVIWIVRI